jgi:gliding motility-associated-like protein
LPAADAGADQNVCDGSDVTLTASGGTQYQWNTNPPQSGATITVTPAAPITYTVTVTDATGCTATDAVLVDLYTAVSITDALQDPTCSNSNDGQITVNVTSGTAPFTYTVTGQTPVTTSNTTQGFTGLTDDTYTITVAGANGCSANLTNRVLTSPAPVVFTPAVLAPACFGQDSGMVTLDNANLSYSFDGGAFSPTLTYNNLPAGAYTIIGEAAGGCRDTVDVTVSEPAALAVDVDPDSATITEGEMVNLQSAVSGGSTPYNYMWDPIDRLSCADCASPVASPLDTIIYRLTVIDDKGCTGTDTVLINVRTATRLTFPTAFTPDGDHRNDNFRPILTGDLDSFLMRIYNRWGEKIFETNDYKTGWNGYYKGELQPISTYVFYVEYLPAGASETIIDQGNFTLLR